MIAMVRESIFQFVGTKHYTRKDGSASALAVWRGTCRECGAAFDVDTPASLHTLMQSKALSTVNCPAHRRKPKASPQQGAGMADSKPMKKEWSAE